MHDDNTTNSDYSYSESSSLPSNRNRVGHNSTGSKALAEEAGRASKKRSIEYEYDFASEHQHGLTKNGNQSRYMLQKGETCGDCEGCRQPRCMDCSLCKRTATNCIFRLCSHVSLHSLHIKRCIQEGWNLLESKEDKYSQYHCNLVGEIDLQTPCASPINKESTLPPTVVRKSPRRSLSNKRGFSSTLEIGSVYRVTHPTSSSFCKVTAVDGEMVEMVRDAWQAGCACRRKRLMLSFLSLAGWRAVGQNEHIALASRRSHR
jgi:hypothetical protein